MNNPPSRIPSRVRRAAAFCVALLCCWMATVGVVCHTDDFQLGGSSSAHVVLHHGISAVASSDGCAACQWLASIQAVTQTPSIVTTPQVFQPCSYTASNPAPLWRFSAQNGSRAPPLVSILSPLRVVS